MYNNVAQHSMLFGRFIFVLYILFCYVWFLLGTVYNSPVRMVSIVSMICSMASVIIISLFQLQTLTNRSMLTTASKWSTVAWATIHMLIGIMFFIDGMEWVNVVVILGVLGILISFIIFVVGGCACYTIMQNGDDWHAHVHLTCISFWVVIQYMTLQLPDAPNFTFIPIILMAILRYIDLYPSMSILEAFGWCCCIILHIVYNFEVINETFFWGIFLTLILLSAPNLKSILTMAVLPLILLPIICYVFGRIIMKYPSEQILTDLGILYKEIFLPEEEDLIPLDMEENPEDWSGL